MDKDHVKITISDQTCFTLCIFIRFEIAASPEAKEVAKEETDVETMSAATIAGLSEAVSGAMFLCVFDMIWGIPRRPRQRSCVIRNMGTSRLIMKHVYLLMVSVATQGSRQHSQVARKHSVLCQEVERGHPPLHPGHRLHPRSRLL